MDHKYQIEVLNIIDKLIASSARFTIYDIKNIVEESLQNNNIYYDEIDYNSLKSFVIDLFESGDIINYNLSVKYIYDDDDDTPKTILEFVPSNPFDYISIIKKPIDDYSKISCNIHNYYKKLIKLLSGKIGCSQDALIRSILIVSLNMINDRLK